MNLGFSKLILENSSFMKPEPIPEKKANLKFILEEIFF